MAGPMLVLGGVGLTALELMHVCPRRAFAPKCRYLERGVKPSKEPVSRLATVSRCLRAYAWRGVVVMAPTTCFVLGEALPRLPDALEGGGTVSPSLSQGILRSRALIHGYLPSTGALRHPQGSTPARPQTSKTPDFQPHLL